MADSIKKTGAKPSTFSKMTSEAKRTTAKKEISSSETGKSTKKKTVKSMPSKPMSELAKKRIRVAILIFIIFLSVYVLVSAISYLSSWSSDQSFVLSGEKVVSDKLLQNDAGRIGARIGRVLVSDWFGIFGLFIPIALIIVSFLMVYRKKMLFVKILLSTLSGVVIWSTAATFLVPQLNGIYGSSLGGGFGIMMSKFLVTYIGNFGTLLSLLFGIILWSLYTYPKSFDMFLSIGKGFVSILVFIFSRRRKKVSETDETIDEIIEEGDLTRYAEERDDLINGFESEKNRGDLPNDTELYSDVDELKSSKFEEDKFAGDVIGDQSGENAIEDKFADDVVDDIVNKENINENVPFVFDVPTIDERDRVGTHRNDMNQTEFEIVVSSDAQVIESGNSTIIKTESDSIDINDIDQTLFDPTLELSRFKLPPIELLEDRPITSKITEAEIHENKEIILNTLRNFSIEISSIRATVGPTVTLYEIVPATGVRISKIKNLEDDIALSLSALGIRIIAPMPGKGTIGIEVPNKDKEVVSMYSVVASGAFQDSDAELPIVLGRTIQNHNFVLDLAKMPHMLVAGATGQGKSVGLNAIISSLLYKKHPSELKFVMVDPKKVELSLYTLLEKHYLAKMAEETEAIITDTQRVIYTLNSLCIEMDNRYELLKVARVKNIKEYNTKFKNRRLNPNKGHHFMPYIVVIIDEFADLIMTAGKEVETPISRLAQLARAIGIHLVIATQRPSVNVITGIIKANFPARIAFRVMTSIDSKTILDSTGANQLIGRGDMLVSVGGEITRVQCAFIDTPEIEKISEFIGNQTGFETAMILPEYVPESEKNRDEDSSKVNSKRDAMFDEIARYIVTNQQGSTSTIQRNFEIGFNRAGRIMDQLQRAGVVGRQQGSKARDVLIGDLTSLELMLYDLDNNRFNVD